MRRGRVTGGLLAVLLAGCGTAANQELAQPPVAAPTGVAVPQAQAPARNAAPNALNVTGKSALTDSSAGTAGTPGSGPSGTLPLGTPTGQNIERSVAASYTVSHGQFMTAFNGVITKGVGLGGYVVSSATNPDDTGVIVYGTVTLAIPADKLASLLSDLPTDFQTSSINFGSVDHTSQFVDLNAQLASARAHHDVLLRLLAGANNLTDITALDQQIADVEQQINTLQGQFNAVQHSVDYSTASISLSERGAKVTPPTAASSPSPWQPLADAVSKGLGNARDVLAAVIAALLSVLPLLVVAIALFATRRRWMPSRQTALRPQPAVEPTE